MGNIKVNLSVGLVLLVVLNAALTGVAVQALHEVQCHHQHAQPACCKCDCDPCRCGNCDCDQQPVRRPRLGKPFGFGSEGVIPNAPAQGINAAGLGETKQGIGASVPVTQAANKVASPGLSETKQQGVVSQAPCIPCQQQRRPVYVQPYAQPYVQPYAQPYVQPAQPAPAPVQTPRPASKPHKLALFLDGSQRSNQVLQWFTQEPELARLRANCEFQVYSPNDTLYLTRYAAIVPRAAMPAVLWSYQVEGDVNQKAAAQVAAIGGSDMPWTSSELAGLMKHAYSLFEQAKNAPAAQQMAQPMNTGVSWENFASPQLTLQEASFSDCGPGGCGPNGCDYDECGPDGCNVDGPGSRFRPFDRPDHQGRVRDLYGMSLESLVALGILVVIAGVAIVYILKK